MGAGPGAGRGGGGAAPAGWPAGWSGRRGRGSSGRTRYCYRRSWTVISGRTAPAQVGSPAPDAPAGLLLYREVETACHYFICMISSICHQRSTPGPRTASPAAPPTPSTPGRPSSRQIMRTLSCSSGYSALSRQKLSRSHDQFV